MAGIVSDLIGTVRNTFRIKRATFDASGLTAARTFTLPDASGTIGSGDVVGPATATDNAIARYDATTGKVVQNSPNTIDDAGKVIINATVSSGQKAWLVKIGGVERAHVNEYGNIIANGVQTNGGTNISADAYVRSNAGGVLFGNGGWSFDVYLSRNAAGSLLLGSSWLGYDGSLKLTTVTFADGTFSTDGTGALRISNGAATQTLRVYGTRTDASNYRRVALGMTTAGVATLTAEGAGTGASGNVLHISSLPTSNPGPGILWNNAGTPAIGT